MVHRTIPEKGDLREKNCRKYASGLVWFVYLVQWPGANCSVLHCIKDSIVLMALWISKQSLAAPLGYLKISCSKKPPVILCGLRQKINVTYLTNIPLCASLL
ncbi:unnamed protein product [Meganyctiphanes norvegica]|uniref:Uncharacterized protein n=1 Tax=Meganyctiphanes norvegica TaxID=48144 RepID=A0AAV2PLH2_MEGNR